MILIKKLENDKKKENKNASVVTALLLKWRHNDVKNP